MEYFELFYLALFFITVIFGVYTGAVIAMEIHFNGARYAYEIKLLVRDIKRRMNKEDS